MSTNGLRSQDRVAILRNAVGISGETQNSVLMGREIHQIIGRPSSEAVPGLRMKEVGNTTFYCSCFLNRTSTGRMKTCDVLLMRIWNFGWVKELMVPNRPNESDVQTP